MPPHPGVPRTPVGDTNPTHTPRNHPPKKILRGSNLQGGSTSTPHVRGAQTQSFPPPPPHLHPKVPAVGAHQGATRLRAQPTVPGSKRTSATVTPTAVPCPRELGQRGEGPSLATPLSPSPHLRSTPKPHASLGRGSRATKEPVLGADPIPPPAAMGRCRIHIRPGSTYPDPFFRLLPLTGTRCCSSSSHPPPPGKIGGDDSRGAPQLFPGGRNEAGLGTRRGTSRTRSHTPAHYPHRGPPLKAPKSNSVRCVCVPPTSPTAQGGWS